MKHLLSDDFKMKLNHVTTYIHTNTTSPAFSPPMASYPTYNEIQIPFHKLTTLKYISTAQDCSPWVYVAPEDLKHGWSEVKCTVRRKCLPGI